MDPTESELKEALESLTYEMVVMDPAIADWYKTLISNAAAGHPGARRAVLSWWHRKCASGYHNPAKASEREIDMTYVVGTVGTIDPNSICTDTACDQIGEPMKDHRVTHKNKTGPKGQRGTCPHCQGKMHNTNDAAQLIAFQCLWRQAFGDQSRKTPVNADNLYTLYSKVATRTISEWADRTVTLTAAPTAVALPKAVPSAVVTGPLGGATVTGTTITVPVATSVVVAAQTTLAPAIGEIAPQSEEDKAAKRAKIRAALAGAKVLP